MDRETLIGLHERGEKLQFLFFWGHTPSKDAELGPFCLSQWYPSPFVVRGERYFAAEHFMMAEKARLFGDDATRVKILATSDPAEAKKLGRAVRHFNEERWREHRYS